jgi:glycosyltransferase involved in cell wall biosynthesis
MEKIMNFSVGFPLVQNSFNGRAGWIAGYYYAKNCLNALISLPDHLQPQITVFIPDDFYEPLLLPEYHHKQLKIIKIPCNKHGHSFELQNILDKNHCDIYFPFNTIPTFNFSGKMVGWIPDFQHKYFTEFFTEQDINQRELTTQFMLEFADSLACSSRTVELDIERFYPSHQTKKILLPFTSIISKNSLISDSKKILKKYNINQKFIYLPNQFWMHKNHHLVFEAWKLLKSMGHNYLLVCTGEKIDYRNQQYYASLESYIQKHNLKSTIKILGFINREDQIQIIRNAAAILQPSLFEGRNTSIEDAKTLGKKLIVSNIPVHIEQCGENALYFTKDNPEELATVIKTHWDTFSNSINQKDESNAIMANQAEIQKFAYSLLNGFKETLFNNNPPIHKTRSLVLCLSSELQIIQAHAYARQEIIDTQIDKIHTLKKEMDYLLKHRIHKLFKIFYYINILLLKKCKYYSILINNKIKKHLLKTKNFFYNFTNITKNILNGVLNKIKKRILIFIHPKLGQLTLYEPIPLKTPKKYIKKSMPKISIVTPSYQHRLFIERTIKSILEQNYSPMEYIIQDGGSMDGTLEILKNYSSSLTYWESKKDNGQSQAINLGFQHSTGDIMAYLNSDDILLPGSLHYIAEFFQSNPDVDVIYGHRILIDSQDKEIGRWILPKHNSEVLQWADYIPQETLFWRRRIWNKVGATMDESFQFAMDWDLILRFIQSGAKFVRLPRFIGAFRVHSAQKTKEQIANIGLKEMERLRTRIHGRKVSHEEINKAVRSYLKKHLIYHKLYRAGVFRY